MLGIRATRSNAAVVLDATPATAPVAPSTVPPNRSPATTALDDEASRDPDDVPASPAQHDSSAEDDAAATDRGTDPNNRNDTAATDRGTDPNNRNDAAATDRGTDPNNRNDDVERSAAAQPAPSPLAELVGPSWSAIPPEVRPRSTPAGIQIGSIDVARFPIRPVGLQLDGQLEVPDETEIGWYRHGATAGEAGATVLAAHVSWNGTTGPFARLGAVEPGDGIELRLDNGSLRNYEVVERAIYGKLELPTDRIWRRSGEETLVLITCGGAFNPSIRRYEQNIVVYAVPVG